MRSNAWETLRDPRFIGQVQQFYRPTEYTARRPTGAMNANGQGPAATRPGARRSRARGQRPGTQPTPGAPSGAGNGSTAAAPRRMPGRCNRNQMTHRTRQGRASSRRRAGRVRPTRTALRDPRDRPNADKRGADQRESKPLKDTEKADEEPSPSRLRADVPSKACSLHGCLKFEVLYKMEV